MTTVNELLLELLMINSTIAGDYSVANRTLTLLQLDQRIIKDTWTELNSLNDSAQELIVNLTLARDNTGEAELLLIEFNAKYFSLRRNLTSLAVQFDVLRRRFLSVNERATNASMSLDNAESDFDRLVIEVDMEIEEENKTQSAAQQLNRTVNSTQTTAQMALDRVNYLLVSYFCMQ